MRGKWMHTRHKQGLAALLGLSLWMAPGDALSKDFVETVTGTVENTTVYDRSPGNNGSDLLKDNLTINFTTPGSSITYKPYSTEPPNLNKNGLNYFNTLIINDKGTVISDSNHLFFAKAISGNGRLFLNDIQERPATTSRGPYTGAFFTEERGGDTVPISGGLYMQIGGRDATPEAVRSGGVEIDNFHLIVKDPGTQLMVGGLPGMTPKDNGSVFKLWYGGNLTVENSGTLFTNSKIDQEGGKMTVGDGGTLTAVDGLVMKPGKTWSAAQNSEIPTQARVEVKDGGTLLLGNAFTGKALDFEGDGTSRFRVFHGGRVDIGMPAANAPYFTGVNVRVPFEANTYARVRSHAGNFTIWDGGRIALSGEASVYSGQDNIDGPIYGPGVIIENQHTLNVEMRSAQNVSTPVITGGNGLVMRKGSTLKGLIVGDLLNVPAGTSVIYAIADKALLNDTALVIPSDEQVKFATDNTLFSMNLNGEHTAGAPLAVNVKRANAQDMLPQISGSVAALVNNYLPGSNSFVDAILKNITPEAASKALESGMNMQAASSSAQVAQGLSSQLGGFSQQRAAGQSLGSQSLVATLLPGGGMATSDPFGKQANSWVLNMGSSDSGLNGGDMLAQAAASTMTQGLGIWAMPTYGHERLRDMSVGAFKTGADSDVFGGLFGADFTWDAWRVGLAGNIGSGESKSVGDLAKTKNDLDYAGLNLYGSYTWGDFTLGANMGYTRVTNDVKQDNFVGELHSKFNSDVWNVGLRGDYRFATEYVNITPTIGLEYTNYRQKGYDTKLFDQAVVSNGKADMATWRIPVGVTFDRQFELESGGVIAPEFRLRYIPTLGDRNMKTATWLPGSSAVANMTGADVDRHTGEAGLGLQFTKNNLSLSANYDFQFSQHRQAHGLTAQVRYAF